MQPEVWTTALAISGLLGLVALVAAAAAAALTWRARQARRRQRDAAAATLRRSPEPPAPLPGLDLRRDREPSGTPPVGAQAPPLPETSPPAPVSPPASPASSTPLAQAAPPAPTAEPEPEFIPAAPAAAFDSSLQLGLARTQRSLLERIRSALSNSPALDAQVLEGLEEALLLADVGVSLTTRLLDGLRAQHKLTPLTTPAAITEVLRRELIGALSIGPPPAAPQAGLKVVLFVGVNGVGKTTSIGKLAAHMVQGGDSVMLAAGDTFRAAAAEQLEVWSQRAGASFHRGEAGADPAGVIFNGISRARAEGLDVVLADTAGRLHTKVDLMDEIGKVRRAADKATGGGQAEVWLVVDGTTGQNALQQAREFHRAVGLSGVILTKLDGTAKGGVVVAIVDDLKVPIRYLGVGEGLYDLRPFDAHSFVAALLTPT